MKLSEIKNKLPLKIKLTTGFTLEESFDPHTILFVKKIEEDKGWEDGGNKCYKLTVSALKEDMEHNKKVAIADWNDKDGDKTIYDSSFHKKYFDSDGNFNDSIYVMENDDFFEIVEEKKGEIIFPTEGDLIEQLKDLDPVTCTTVFRHLDLYKNKIIDLNKK